MEDSDMDDSIKNWSLPDDAKKVLLERFKQLKEKVFIEVFTKDGVNDQFNTLIMLFTKELSKLSDKIIVNFHKVGDEFSKKYNVIRSPTVLFNPEKYNIRYTGAPFGEESRSFIDTIIMVSHQNSFLSKESKEMISNLKEPRHIQVFVTLSCPYCPGQVLNAFKTAIERPDLVFAEAVDSMENNDLAQKYNVGAVPHTIINGTTISRGFEPEQRFVSELITLKPAENIIEEIQTGGEHVHVDVIIIGGGPAGLTAGIYAARSGLKTVILEKAMVGGQVSITPMVENWPGFRNIPGKQLMDMINTQVRGYVPILEGQEVLEIKVGKYVEAISSGSHFVGQVLILATGTSHRHLGVAGEEKLYGHGVSYCATCDGYFYKNKSVVVVGSGNTAMTDALYLKNLGAKVTIVVRGSEFKGELPLKESIDQEKFPVIWDTEVSEILGDKHVIGIKIKNKNDKKQKELKTEAVFVAIGEIPNNQLASQIGLKLDEYGYVIIDRSGRTNIPRVYGAGDITGGIRQIVTAVGEGATAASSAFEDISHPYWLPKKK
jgi:thioredoxin reductase (NADPH)